MSGRERDDRKKRPVQALWGHREVLPRLPPYQKWVLLMVYFRTPTRSLWWSDAVAVMVVVVGKLVVVVVVLKHQVKSKKNE